MLLNRLTVSAAVFRLFGLVDSLKVSTSAKCGGTTGLTCLGSTFGNCCSPAGYCGSPQPTAELAVSRDLEPAPLHSPSQRVLVVDWQTGARLVWVVRLETAVPPQVTVEALPLTAAPGASPATEPVPARPFQRTPSAGKQTMGPPA
jgi:hypothetical protein